MKNSLKILAFAMLAVLMSFTPKASKKLIVIDAGHGGHDFGSTHGFHSEKDITASISKKIIALNSSDQVEIILLRQADEFTSLEDRINKINDLNPDLVLSLHVNKNANTTAQGIEAYVCENSHYENSKEHAEQLVNVLSTEKLKNRGVKTASFMVLKKSKSAAVTLELGFLSNDSDREYLTSENGQKEIATKIVTYLNK